MVSDIYTTWYLEGLSFDTGESATGSFQYNANLGANGTFSDIAVTSTQDGNVVNYTYANTGQVGDDDYINLVSQNTADLSNSPNLALRLPRAWHQVSAQ